MSFFTKLIDAGTLGGWVRAGLAALFGVIIAKWPLIGSIVGPDLQDAAGVLASGIVVGIWSQIAKAAG